MSKLKLRKFSSKPEKFCGERNILINERRVETAIKCSTDGREAHVAAGDAVSGSPSCVPGIDAHELPPTVVCAAQTASELRQAKQAVRACPGFYFLFNILIN